MLVRQFIIYTHFTDGKTEAQIWSVAWELVFELRSPQTLFFSPKGVWKAPVEPEDRAGRGRVDGVGADRRRTGYPLT